MLTEASVLAAIDHAFRDTVCPDANSLVVGDYFEKLEIRDLLLNRQWHEVDVDMLDGYDQRGDLSVMPVFLSQSAVVYFMPAFLKYMSCQRVHQLDCSFGFSSGDLKEGKEPFYPASYSRDQRAAISQAMAYLEQVFRACNEEHDLGLVQECREAWSSSLARLG